MQRQDGRIVQQVPFPFDELIKTVERKAGCTANKPCTQSVLIPLGRSLQRTAASPDFFQYPRAVVAVTGESQSGGMYLKDRLYLGYQEKTDLIEVISYNEEAARFEFQLVKNYRRGGRVLVLYANRVICLACHQNRAPIFSRQVWDETNANPRIGALLAAQGRSFYGIPIERGIDTPNAIDEAIGRANELAITATLWNHGCADSAECRSAVVSAAAQFRLSGERAYESTSARFVANVVQSFSKNALKTWTDGLAVPASGIPNRDPLAHTGSAKGAALAHVDAAFEALVPRAPMEVISPEDSSLPDRLVKGVAAMFANADIGELRRKLAARPRTSREVGARCAFERARGRQRFQCGGDRVRLAGTIEGGEAELESIAVDNGPSLRHFQMRARGHHVRTLTPLAQGIRLHDGNAVESIVLDTQERVASVRISEDFSVYVRSMGPASRGLTRAALLETIRIVPPSDQGDSALPPPRAEIESRTEDVTPEISPFVRHCAICHRTLERTPPNFLHGDARSVAKALRQCAPRILARLSMGLLPPSSRTKTPMPPELSSRNGSPDRLGLDGNQIRELLGALAQFIDRPSGKWPSVEKLLVDGYEALPPCLTEESR